MDKTEPSLSNLPVDVARSILYLLDDTDLVNVCSLNDNFSVRICNDNFWINKIVNKYGLSMDQIKMYSRGGTYLAYYLKLNQYLRSYPDLGYMLNTASTNGITDLAIVALKRGANIHNNNDWPLRYASEYGHTEVVKVLLENGADVHANDDAALRYASTYGHTKTVRVLLEHRANVHAYGNWALTVASRNGHTETVRLLQNAL